MQEMACPKPHTADTQIPKQQVQTEACAARPSQRRRDARAPAFSQALMETKEARTRRDKETRASTRNTRGVALSGAFSQALMVALHVMKDEKWTRCCLKVHNRNHTIAPGTERPPHKHTQTQLAPNQTHEQAHTPNHTHAHVHTPNHTPNHTPVS